MPPTIHHEIDIPASPERVYAVLTDAAQFSAMTDGKAASIDAVDGGALSLFDGMITGRNIELVPGKRVVQAWRVGNWDAGVYSIARFALASHGDGTRITFDHTGFPPEHHSHLEPGWHGNYWEPLKAYLAHA